MKLAKQLRCLKKTIKIVVQDGGNVLSYGDEFDDLHPIFILYTPLGQNSGHYDCLMQRQSSHFPNVSLSPIAGLELPTLPPKKGTGNRKRKAELLTSSPYKNTLETATKAKAPKKSVPPKTKSVKPVAKRKLNIGKKEKHAFGRQGVKESNATSSWHCFICDDSFVEEMICCRNCEKWVHVDCAGTDDILFVCDICSGM